MDEEVTCFVKASKLCIIDNVSYNQFTETLQFGRCKSHVGEGTTNIKGQSVPFCVFICRYIIAKLKGNSLMRNAISEFLFPLTHSITLPFLNKFRS